MKDFPFIRTLKNAEATWWVVFQCAATIFIIYFEFQVAKPAFAQGGGGSMFGLATTMILGLALNILWRNAIIDFICSPLTNLMTGGNEVSEKKPLYSAAIAKRNRGDYYEAIAEVRKQLDKFPNDLQGVLLLAGIQAENMKDLPTAEITLNRFCERPTTAANAVAIALTQLADWYLKVADTDSARAAFQKIVERFPSTEAAVRAELRLAHLGETEKIILAQHDRQNITVPEGVQNIGLLGSTAFLRPEEADPKQLAETYIRHLEAHPHDSVEREKLAILYARDFKRLDLAEAELEQLINETNHKPKQVAHWLNLLANFQIELGADAATVRGTLEKIVERFTELPVAEIARRRLALLNNEFRGRQETTIVKLGVYEQNLGLKYGRPTKP
jgi:tetratricopeptide (TPR) repeat protein